MASQMDFMNDQSKNASLIPMGDSCWLVQFQQEISLDINRKVQALAEVLERAQHPWIREIVPTYCSLAVYYDPFQIEAYEVECYLWAEINLLNEAMMASSVIWEIPVLYGGEWGPDLVSLALRVGLKPEEVIAIHSHATYHVYMLGFVPGFCYLGKVSPKIAGPRLDNPRKSVPAGSVGIAGLQTGIYPIKAPGGWQIIGRTPLGLYDPKREKAVFVKAGDRVRFKPIDLATYHMVAQKVKMGWQPTPIEGTKSDGNSGGHQGRFIDYGARPGALWTPSLRNARSRRHGHLFLASSQSSGRQ
ncbi:5-oxoprolinase subunit PxpB [Heliobacterium chlorum]|uniref:5-oxoprolinase subunit PxpB n=1 Tax=Heliobacterium chlorum TaxID=2698 RepID=UPI00311A94D3